MGSSSGEQAVSGPPRMVGVLGKDLKVRIRDAAAIGYLVSKEFGVRENEHVALDPVEALYLLRRGALVVKDEQGRELTFADLVTIYSEKDPELWVKLEIYADLRKRGLYAKPSYMPGPVFLVDRKKKDKVERFIVYVFIEGRRIGFTELEKAFERARASGRELVVAVVDKEGNVSYYRVTKMT